MQRAIYEFTILLGESLLSSCRYTWIILLSFTSMGLILLFRDPHVHHGFLVLAKGEPDRINWFFVDCQIARVELFVELTIVDPMLHNGRVLKRW